MRKSTNIYSDFHKNDMDTYKKTDLIKSVDNPELFHMQRNSCESIEALNLMKEELKSYISNKVSESGNIDQSEYKTSMTTKIKKQESLDSPVKIAGNRYLDQRTRELPKYQ